MVVYIIYIVNYIVIHTIHFPLENRKLFNKKLEFLYIKKKKIKKYSFYGKWEHNIENINILYLNIISIDDYPSNPLKNIPNFLYFLGK